MSDWNAPWPDAEATCALQRLAGRYWAQADGTEPLAIAELFSQDAMLQLGQLKLEGRASIEAFFATREETQRASGRTTRHLASNFLATPIDYERVSVKSTVAVFAGTGDPPLPIDLPMGIADFEDICWRTPQGQWLFTQRVGRTIFVGAGAASFAR